MRREPEKQVKPVEFARLMGCTPGTITNYLKAGKLYGAALELKPTGKVRWLNYDTAKAQFLEARAATEARFAGAGGAPLGKTNNHTGKPPRTKAADTSATTSPSSPTGVDEAVRADLGKLDRKLKAGRAGSLSTKAPDFVAEMPAREPAPGGGDIEETTVESVEPENENPGEVTYDANDMPTGTPGQLRNRELQLKVRKAEVELAEKLGTLVAKDSVYRALFVAGQEIRAAFESVADRVIDMILAAPNRAAGHALLSAEINQILGRLAELPSMNVTAEQRTAKGGK